MKKRPFKADRTITLPRGLVRDLLDVCNCNILHRHGFRQDKTWGCLPSCGACTVLHNGRKHFTGVA